MKSNQYDKFAKNLEKALTRAPEVMRDEIRVAVDDTVKATVRDARGRAPVETGALRDAIKGKVSKGGTGIVGIERRKGEMNIKSYQALDKGGRRKADRNPANYGSKVEFGTSRTKAQPFMLPAAEGQRAPFANRVKLAGKRAEHLLAREAQTSVVVLGNSRTF